jgi:hypothetical protein
MKPYLPGKPEIRMIRLELQHACAAIERARLLAPSVELQTDLANLREAAHELLNGLIKERTP